MPDFKCFYFRADYWKSNPRHFCEFCKCWIADNKPVSIQVFFHVTKLLSGYQVKHFHGSEVCICMLLDFLSVYAIYILHNVE